MTNQEYAKLISQLPESTLKEYGFNEPFDYSQYECIHTTEFDYYPQLDCVIINNVPIVWQEDVPYADPRKPKHLREFKRRVELRTKDAIAIVSIGLNDKKMYCSLCWKNEKMMQHIKKLGLTATPFEEGDIYYDPDSIDLPNTPDMLLLAKCLFTAKKYNTIGLLPDPNTNPLHWEDVIFVPSDRINSGRQ